MFTPAPSCMVHFVKLCLMLALCMSCPCVLCYTTGWSCMRLVDRGLQCRIDTALCA
jgi:hypothetical protein